MASTNVGILLFAHVMMVAVLHVQGESELYDKQIRNTVIEDVMKPPVNHHCNCSQYPVNWTSIEPKARIGLTHLLEATTESFTIPDIVPSGVREVLIFVALSSAGSKKGTIQDLKVYTQIGITRYAKYINLFVWSENAYSTNSDNMWFPMPPDRKIYLTTSIAVGPGIGVYLDAIGYR